MNTYRGFQEEHTFIEENLFKMCSLQSSASARVQRIGCLSTGIIITFSSQ